MISLGDSMIRQINFEKSFDYIGASVFLLLLVLLTWLLQLFIKFKIYQRRINKLPGPATVPILGNMKIGVPQEYYFRRGMAFTHFYKGGIFRLWIGPFPVVIVMSPETVEPILSSTVELQKGIEYEALKTWLGEGLITTSKEKRWQSHRRLLTPAFHFRILEDFLMIMNEKADILVRKLETKADGEVFKVFNYIKLCALDIICESAMGSPINAQVNEDSDYVMGVPEIAKIAFIRAQLRPWLRNNFLYRLTSLYKQEQKYIGIVKGFTEKVIQEKKTKLLQKDIEKDEPMDTNTRKKKMAFLDLILSTKTGDGKIALTDSEIQEEVDTFMFAGHDTTTTATCWTLFALGHHPEIQDKVYEELEEIFGDSKRHVTLNDIRKMKYLECVVKETLRAYPVVPVVARKLKNDVNLGGHTVPAGISVFIHIYGVHHNPSVWEDPNKFDPDRFKTENIAGKHPYAFIPFSAGARNCIGQKFALNEEKVLLSAILRNFKVASVVSRDEVAMKNLVVLTNPEEFPIRLTPRKGLYDNSLTS